MTEQDFLVFYPQFSSFTPAVVLRAFLAQANSRFSDFSEPDMEEARRLYAAHKLTMYARTALPEGAVPDRAAIASAGRNQRIASKKVGEVSVTYADGASSFSASSDLADLAETDYGLQLLTLIRMYIRPVYIP